MEIDTSYMEKCGNYGSALPFQICILKNMTSLKEERSGIV